jgi:hypothetical protein
MLSRIFVSVDVLWCMTVLESLGQLCFLNILWHYELSLLRVG